MITLYDHGLTDRLGLDFWGEPMASERSHVTEGWKAGCLRALGRGIRLLPKGRSTAFRAGWRMLGAPPAFVGTFQGVEFVVRPCDAATSLSPFLFQRYEPLLVKTIREHLTPGGVFVDIGANIGLVSLLSTGQLGDGGRVFSYEPLPQNVTDMQFLRAQAQVSPSRWTIEPFALSDCAGTARIEWTGESGWCQISEHGETEIDTRTFDEEMKRHQIDDVDFVKIDVEGHEAAVIRGMQDSIGGGAIGALLLELHVPRVTDAEVDEIMTTFRQSGYSSFAVREKRERSGTFNATFDPVDISFRPQSRMHLLFRNEKSDSVFRE